MHSIVQASSQGLRHHLHSSPLSLYNLNPSLQAYSALKWRPKTGIGTLAESMKRRLHSTRFTSNKIKPFRQAAYFMYSRRFTGMASSSAEIISDTCQESLNTATDAASSETSAIATHKFSASPQVDAALMKFVYGKRGEMKESIEKETRTTVIIPSPHKVKKGSCIVIEGSSQEAVDVAVARVHSIVDEAVKSRSLDYSHFISLPLGTLPGIIDHLTKFQESVLALAKRAREEKAGQKVFDYTEGMQSHVEVDNDKESYAKAEQKSSDTVEGTRSRVEVNNEKESYTEPVAGENDEDEDADKVIADEDAKKIIADEEETEKGTHCLEGGMEIEEITDDSWGIEKSIFVKPATFHLTVLMLKLWNNERVAAAAEALQRCKSKVHEALEGRPVAVRIKGLKCMRGSPAKAHVLYACVEEADQGDRLVRACQAIIDEFVAAGLVIEADIRQDLKLHATLMNTRHRNMKRHKRSKRRAINARQILLEYGSIDFGEHCIQEVHLSQRFAYGVDGYYACCGYIELPSITS